MFGEPGAPLNWQFLMKDDGRIGKLKLANWRARCNVHNINNIVTICIRDDREKEQWLDVFHSYRDTIEVSLFEYFTVVFATHTNKLCIILLFSLCHRKLILWMMRFNLFRQSWMTTFQNGST
jgi:hypothetical protein